MIDDHFFSFIRMNKCNVPTLWPTSCTVEENTNLRALECG